MNMKFSKVFLITIFASILFLPSVYAISFIGPIEFIGTRGGIITFDANFQASRYNDAYNLNFFSNLVWGGTIWGHIGFDADIGVNMTILEITRDTVTYNVTTGLPGNVNTYLYYYRSQVSLYPSLSEPTEVTGGTYTYAGGVANVTTSGSSVIVAVTYGSGSGVSSNFIEAQDVLIALIPFFVLITIVSDMEPTIAPRIKAGINSRSVYQKVNPATASMVMKKEVVASAIAPPTAERKVPNSKAVPFSNKIIISVTVVRIAPASPNCCGETKPKTTGPTHIPITINQRTSGTLVRLKIAVNRCARKIRIPTKAITGAMSCTGVHLLQQTVRHNQSVMDTLVSCEIFVNLSRYN